MMARMAWHNMCVGSRSGQSLNSSMKLRWKSASLLSTPSRASSPGRKVVRKWCVPSTCRKPERRRGDSYGGVIAMEG